MGLSAEALGHCISMAVVPNVILKQVRRDGKTKIDVTPGRRNLPRQQAAPR